jgi:hypothetical protein
VPQLRVLSFAMSLDGFGAGPHQDLEHPLGVGGERLMDWLFHTRLWQQMHGDALALGLAAFLVVISVALLLAPVLGHYRSPQVTAVAKRLMGRSWPRSPCR